LSPFTAPPKTAAGEQLAWNKRGRAGINPKTVRAEKQKKCVGEDPTEKRDKRADGEQKEIARKKGRNGGG